MKKIICSCYVFLTIILLTFVSCTDKKQQEHVTPIITHILNTKSTIENHLTHNVPTPVHPVFVSFWDFDGTILKGDCSEGYEEEGTQIYKGLVQIAIEQKFSKFYKPDEFKKFFDYYLHSDKTQGHFTSYTYLTKIFAGQNEQTLVSLATNYFNSTLQRYYFASSLAIMKKLVENNIHIYIISASPDFFVKGAAQSLNVHPNNIHGIKLKTTRGILTNTIMLPVTYAEGKTEKVKEILSTLKKSHSTEHVYALAAFGNSYHTDGPFLRYVATQKFPAGTPVAVMINGGTPPSEYHGIFQCVSYSQIIGDNN
ncbi:MAG: haloacid dehalogenase-like hydrolase [Spirochaetota bacterium]